MRYTHVKILALSVLTLNILIADPVSVEGAEEIAEKSASAGAGDVAKKLANPVAAMISVPFQFNYRPNLGPHDGAEWLTNVQPVIPIDLNDEWNLISRTIIPLTNKYSVPTDSNRHTKVADIVQSAWLSPKEPTESGWIWGAGAAFLIPSGSEISAKKWGAGPTGLALKQDGPWTYGGLFNHIWDVGGSDIIGADGNVANKVNQTFMQPFLTYITPKAVTFALNTESTYDWERKQWTVPVNFTITKVVKVGSQIMSVGGGVTYWAEAPENGPEGLGIRILCTFIFPK